MPSFDRNTAMTLNLFKNLLWSDPERTKRTVSTRLAAMLCAALVCAWVPAQALDGIEKQAEPQIVLVVHSQGAGANAVDTTSSRPAGVVKVDYYHYFFAQGRGQRQQGVNQDVRQENITTPLGLGQHLLLKSEASNGTAQSHSAVDTVIHKTSHTLNVIGTIAARSGGIGAMSFAQLMLGVAIKGPSKVRIENCGLFEQDVLTNQAGFTRTGGTCTFQISGNPRHSVDSQNLPMPSSARGGQFVMFEIDIKLGGLSGSPGSTNGGFSIEVLPGIGECTAVFEGPGGSALEGWVITDLLDGLPGLTIVTRTDHDMALIQDEIDFGLSPYADEEAHELATRAAAKLASSVDADLRVEVSGSGTAEGLHSVSLTPRNGSSVTLEFDFDQAQNFQDVEAYILQVVESANALIRGCEQE